VLFRSRFFKFCEKLTLKLFVFKLANININNTAVYADSALANYFIQPTMIALVYIH